MIGLRTETDPFLHATSRSHYRSSKFASGLVGRFFVSGVSGSFSKHRKLLLNEIKINARDYEDGERADKKYLNQPVLERNRRKELIQTAKDLLEMRTKLEEIQRMKAAKRHRDRLRRRRQREYLAALVIQNAYRNYRTRCQQQATLIICNVLRCIYAKNALKVYHWAIEVLTRFIKRVRMYVKTFQLKKLCHTMAQLAWRQVQRDVCVKTYTIRCMARKLVDCWICAVKPQNTATQRCVLASQAKIRLKFGAYLSDQQTAAQQSLQFFLTELNNDSVVHFIGEESTDARLPYFSPSDSSQTPAKTALEQIKPNIPGAVYIQSTEDFQYPCIELHAERKKKVYDLNDERVQKLLQKHQRYLAEARQEYAMRLQAIEGAKAMKREKLTDVDDKRRIAKNTEELMRRLAAEKQKRLRQLHHLEQERRRKAEAKAVENAKQQFERECMKQEDGFTTTNGDNAATFQSKRLSRKPSIVDMNDLNTFNEERKIKGSNEKSARRPQVPKFSSIKNVVNLEAVRRSQQHGTKRIVYLVDVELHRRKAQERARIFLQAKNLKRQEGEQELLARKLKAKEVADKAFIFEKKRKLSCNGAMDVRTYSIRERTQNDMGNEERKDDIDPMEDCDYCSEALFTEDVMGFDKEESYISSSEEEEGNSLDLVALEFPGHEPKFCTSYVLLDGDEHNSEDDAAKATPQDAPVAADTNTDTAELADNMVLEAMDQLGSYLPPPSQQISSTLNDEKSYLQTNMKEGLNLENKVAAHKNFKHDARARKQRAIIMQSSKVVKKARTGPKIPKTLQSTPYYHDYTKLEHVSSVTALNGWMKRSIRAGNSKLIIERAPMRVLAEREDNNAFYAIEEVKIGSSKLHTNQTELPVTLPRPAKSFLGLFDRLHAPPGLPLPPISIEQIRKRSLPCSVTSNSEPERTISFPQTFDLKPQRRCRYTVEHLSAVMETRKVADESNRKKDRNMLSKAADNRLRKRLTQLQGYEDKLQSDYELLELQFDQKLQSASSQLVPSSGKESNYSTEVLQGLLEQWMKEDNLEREEVDNEMTSDTAKNDGFEVRESAMRPMLDKSADMGSTMLEDCALKRKSSNILPEEDGQMAVDGNNQPEEQLEESGEKELQQAGGEDLSGDSFHLQRELADRWYRIQKLGDNEQFDEQCLSLMRVLVTFGTPRLKLQQIQRSQKRNKYRVPQYRRSNQSISIVFPDISPCCK